MPTINDNYLKLKAGYLFPEIRRRVEAFAAANPSARIIRMGIGDVTEPLAPAVVAAMRQAVDEMAHRDTFQGYPPEHGYAFLRQAIANGDYAARGCDILPDEIYVSDGAKCDTANILDIFGPDNIIAVTDPVYPVYVDTNVMAGHTGNANARGEYDGLIYLPATADNGFWPAPPRQRADIVYLCSPNNPTGAALSRAALAAWVDYARSHDAIVFYDSAYEAYITDPAIPHSIYEIPGARAVAIEFRSFSKLAGFTGVRCAYTVIPRELSGRARDGSRVPLSGLWARRHATKFNGVSYVTQRGAQAVYSDEGRPQVRRTIDFYMGNARVIRQGLQAMGLKVFGGADAPYVWCATPRGLKSWDFFDLLLQEANVVVTPGAGFGGCGEGYVRISAFNSRQNVEEAVARLQQRIKA
jgi:LL-diaminopimelate aminotransferase